MKRKRTIVISIVLIVSFVASAISGYFGLQKYYQSSSYWEKEYKRNPTTENLVTTCMILYSENDIKFLDYMNIAIEDASFKSICQQTYPREEKDAAYNFLVSAAIQVSFDTNDFEQIKDSIIKYYPMISADDKFRVLCVGLQKCSNNSFKLNVDEFIDIMNNMYTSEQNSDEKIEEMLVLFSYYSSSSILEVDKMNSLYKQFYNQLNEKQSSQDDQFWKDLYQQYISYWDILLA